MPIQCWPTLAQHRNSTGRTSTCLPGSYAANTRHRSDRPPSMSQHQTTIRSTSHARCHHAVHKGMTPPRPVQYMRVQRLPNTDPRQDHCFLVHMTAILDFTHNTMSKVFFDHATMSDMPENPIVDIKIKIKNLCLFCQKWYQFIVWPWTNGGHLRFYPQCNAQDCLCPHHNVGHARKPYSRHPIHQFASIMSKIIYIYDNCKKNLNHKASEYAHYRRFKIVCLLICHGILQSKSMLKWYHTLHQSSTMHLSGNQQIFHNRAYRLLQLYNVT